MLFSLGLNLTPPWKVVKSEFLVPETSTVRELHLWIDFERGSCFMSSKDLTKGCGANSSALLHIYFKV